MNNSGGGRLAAIGVLVVFGVIIADILVHPQGTAAAAGGVTSILTPSYAALLGATAVGKGTVTKQQ